MMLFQSFQVLNAGPLKILLSYCFGCGEFLCKALFGRSAHIEICLKIGCPMRPMIRFSTNVHHKIIPSDCPMSGFCSPILVAQVSSPATPVPPRGSDMRSVGLCAICIFPAWRGRGNLNENLDYECKNNGSPGKTQENTRKQFH